MKITTNPKSTLEDLTKDFDYKYLNSDFKLPTDKIGKFGYQLLKLDKSLRTDEVEDWVKEKGYQLATIREVLEFSNQYPEEQKNGWIFTIEQIAGQFFYAILRVFGDGRSVCVDDYHPDGRWHDSYRVLVRELEAGELGTLTLTINGQTYKYKQVEE